MRALFTQTLLAKNAEFYIRCEYLVEARLHGLEFREGAAQEFLSKEIRLDTLLDNA